MPITFQLTSAGVSQVFDTATELHDYIITNKVGKSVLIQIFSNGNKIGKLTVKEYHKFEKTNEKSISNITLIT